MTTTKHSSIVLRLELDVAHPAETYPVHVGQTVREAVERYIDEIENINVEGFGALSDECRPFTIVLERVTTLNAAEKLPQKGA